MSAELLFALQAMAGAVIVSCCAVSFVAMSRRTRHCFRFVYGVLGVAGLAIAFLPLAPAYADLRVWATTGLVVGIAVYMLLDRRRIGKDRP